MQQSPMKSPIIGTVDDPEDNLWYYRVHYARADRGSSQTSIWTTPTGFRSRKAQKRSLMASWLCSIHPACRTTRMPSLLKLRRQWCRICATNHVLCGRQCPGRQFYVEFTDISIPSPEFQLKSPECTTQRMHRTKAISALAGCWACRTRGFGSGGNCPGRSTKRGNDKFIPDRTKVYLTNPAGQRVGFTYREELSSVSFFGPPTAPTSNLTRVSTTD